MAGAQACKALISAGLESPEDMSLISKQECRQLLRDSGYDRYGEGVGVGTGYGGGGEGMETEWGCRIEALNAMLGPKPCRLLSCGSMMCSLSQPCR